MSRARFVSIACFSITVGLGHEAWADCPLIGGKLVVDAEGDCGWNRGDTRAAGDLGFAIEKGRGALILKTTIPTIAGTDKATADNRSAPFDRTVSPFAAGIAFKYQWYRRGVAEGDSSPTVATAALKLGVRTASLNLPTTSNIHEQELNLIFVYEPYQQGKITESGVWSDATTTETITSTGGLFWLVNLSGDTRLPYGLLSGNLGGPRQADLQTLATWQSRLSLAGVNDAVIASLQLGIGSANPDLFAAVDYLEFATATVGPTHWDFAYTNSSGTTTMTAPPDGVDLIDGSLDTLSLPFAGPGVDTNKVEAIVPSDVVGSDLEEKRYTLDTIAAEIEVAKAKADKQPGAAATRLKWVLDFILGDISDPSDDLIFGEIGAAIRGLVDEARRALKQGR